MGAVIFAFLYKYFFVIILTYIVGMFSKALIKDFGNDRATKIKETILSAMLWAEEQFGIGNGNQKWEEAWKKIRELLAVQGITLSTSEIPVVETLMKSNVPKINAITYSALPKEALQDRVNRTPEVAAMIDKLKEKYPPKIL
jgi:hypothetical protein